MEHVNIACLHQETLLSIDPASPESVVNVSLPSKGASAFASRLSPKRRRIVKTSTDYSEESFSRDHIASEASIYFRPRHGNSRKRPYPRAILWRILETGSLLELQAVDLTQDRSEKQEAILAIRLSFHQPIRPKCIAFAEPEGEEGGDSFLCFAITISGELVKLTLRRDAFIRRGILDSDNSLPTKWCQIYTPSALSHNTPVRLYAKNERELWVSLSNGSIANLKNWNSEPNAWPHTFFSEGDWKSTMREWLWKGPTTVTYDNMKYHMGTAISIVQSPSEKYVWAACLDGTFKAWMVSTGNLVAKRDLAGTIRPESDRHGIQTVEPSCSGLVQLLPGSALTEYHIVTYSPSDRTFKIWAVNESEDEKLSIEDARPDVTLLAPFEDLIRTTMWTIDSFSLRRPKKRGDHSWTLWALVRFGARAQALKVDFNLDDLAQSLTKSWQNDWSIVDPAIGRTDRLHEIAPSVNCVPDRRLDLQSIAVRWLDFFFYPGRFNYATLETALSVYSSGMRQNTVKTRHSFPREHSTSLKERICQTVGSSTALGLAVSGEPAYEQYKQNLMSHWQMFHGVVQDLHKRRHDLLNLSFDSDEDLPWLILADRISPVRTSSELDILWTNKDTFSSPEQFAAGDILNGALLDSKNSVLGQLFNAIHIFRDGLSAAFVNTFASMLQHYVLSNISGSDVGIIQSFYEKSDFARQVSDEDYDRLTGALDALGGFANVDNDLLLAMLDLLREPVRGHQNHKQLTKYGARLLIEGAQQTLFTASEIVLDLLLFVTFMEGELEASDLSQNFHAPPVFEALVVAARQLQLLAWLAGSSRREATNVNFDARAQAGEETIETASDRLHALAAPVETVLESIFIGDWSSLQVPTVPQTALLTYWCRAWTFGLQLHEEYDIISSNILGNLLRGQDLDLAVDFSKFVGNTPWSKYLLGRMHLTTSDYFGAAFLFEAAADGLVNGRHLGIAHLDSANLLDLEERTLLESGFPGYCRHVVGLFEGVKVASYAADFATLALEHLEREAEPDENLRTDLLSRLFTANLKTSRYKEAHRTLSRFTNTALWECLAPDLMIRSNADSIRRRKSSLHSLLRALISHRRVPLLLTLDFDREMAMDVDHYLESFASGPTSAAPFQSIETAQYQKILYSWRLQRNDVRGAASCLWERLQALQSLRGKGVRGRDIDDEVTEMYLVLINVLSLVKAENAWILVKPLIGAPWSKAAGKSNQMNRAEQTGKRRVVTLSEIRKMWQDELDRRADLLAGRYPLGTFEDEAQEVMEVDGEAESDY